jgi:exo-1,4-beta-D-glucosaminidase
VDWAATLDNPVAVMDSYANLTGLQSLPQTSVHVTARTVRRSGPDGADLATTVTISNPSDSVAFFLRADVRRGTAQGQPQPGDNELESSIWQNNDITLFPAEAETLTVTYDSADLRGATPVISLYGWNVPEVDVAAPPP